jgi:two-component system chemotaxis sensor kinase CheA
LAKELDDDTKEIVASFIAEGYERLDDAEAQLEKLGDADDVSRLNAVFRLFHSVKGSASFLGFEHIKKLTHQAETLLEVFIKGKSAVTPEALDVIYATVDALRDIIKTVELQSCDDDCAELADKQAAAILAFLGSLGSPAAAPPAPASAPNPAPQALPEAPEAVDVSAEGELTIRLNELVNQDMVERFCGESLDLLERMERVAMDLPSAANKADSVNELFRSAHVIKGNAGFFDFCPVQARCQEMENYLDGARTGKVFPNAAFANGLIPRIDRLVAIFKAVKVVDPDKAAPNAEKPGEPEGAAYKPIGEILIDIGAVKEDEIQKALEQQGRPLGQILVESGVVAPETLCKALNMQKGMGGTKPREGAEEIQRKEIRVDTGKLDKLFDLVGELITAESMVLNSPDLRGLELDNFQKAYNSLNKVSREIQEVTMMIRMIPMEGLFQKMVRLVRDLSRKVDKPIDLRVSGQETEMDKNVIEQISDPIIHIIRNAIDHGIERQADREAAGKPKEGTLSMDARYEGSEIWVTVKDDGAGLNRKRILEKALEKGMVQGDPAALSDREIWNFIFEPGFSTADIVSDVSGRGVGMDVVKKNLERIRGSVDILTEPGKGTEFILKIPLTMAIVEGITVRVGASSYSLPTTDILEFFKAAPGQLTETAKGKYIVNLRGKTLPLIKVAEAFGVPDAVDDPCQGIIIVVKDRTRTACLLIDEVVGNQQIVVKSLSEYLGKVEGISGCSILGDGRVSFIIDTVKLLSLRLV